ncbi:MAG: MarR family transcriptional regulator [Gemmatimonadota bacterium]
MEVPSGRIKQEIKQGKPFGSHARAAAVSLVRTVDMLKGFIGDVLSAGGITLQQYNVLRILRGAGEAGLPTLEIRERLLERSAGITKLMDRLERKGLVRRERGTDDRRQIRCHITPEALSLLSSLEAPVAAAEEAALGLGPEDLASLLGILDRIRMRVGEQIAAELTDSVAEAE